MKTKLLSLLFALATSIGSAFAESGTCGENLTWNLTNGVLTISGTGDMTNYNFYFDAPWYSQRSTITAISIGNSVTSIGNYAFYQCSSLTSVIIPNSVTSIGNLAFDECTGLTSVTIGNSVTSIGNLAFDECTGLTSVTIPNSVTSIGDGAFLLCTGLTSVSIGNSVTSIGDYVFQGCSGLISITIPNSVTSIGNYAFSSCSGLTSVTIGNSVTSIGNLAFDECTGLTSVTIPNSVTSIGDGAFLLCTCLTSVTIPNCVTSIGIYAFSSCSGLTSIIVESGNTTYDSRNNCNAIIETETNTLIAGCKNTTIPNSVTSIGKGAFSGCSGLTSITIPNSVTSIGKDAFSYCSSLTSITIPNSVTSIGDLAFDECTGLENIYVYRTIPPTAYSNTFFGIDKFSCTLHVLKSSMDMYNAATGWNDFYDVVAINANSITEDVEDVVIIPAENTAEITWPTVPSAASYELVISMNGVVFCTLTFNSSGQLIGIAFAPAVRGNQPQEQVSGFRFTVTGLNSGTQYSYSVAAKNSANVVIDTHSGTFKTLGLSSLEEVLSNNSAQSGGSQKILHNGQLYIIRDGKAYDLTGREL